MQKPRSVKLEALFFSGTSVSLPIATAIIFSHERLENPGRAVCLSVQNIMPFCFMANVPVVHMRVRFCVAL